MTQPAPKTFHVKSFGCQMNVYDGERMTELLGAEGMTATAEADADLVVLNTCHIRSNYTLPLNSSNSNQKYLWRQM